MGRLNATKSQEAGSPTGVVLAQGCWLHLKEHRNNRAQGSGPGSSFLQSHLKGLVVVLILRGGDGLGEGEELAQDGKAPSWRASPDSGLQV